jgi:hypothetical protein
MCLKDGNRLPTLDEQGFVRFKLHKRFNDLVKTIPVPSCFASAPVYNEMLRIFSYLWIQNVTKHTQNALNLPVLTMQLRTSYGFNGTLNLEFGHRQLTTNQKITRTRFNPFTRNPPGF